MRYVTVLSRQGKLFPRLQFNFNVGNRKLLSDPRVKDIWCCLLIHPCTKEKKPFFYITDDYSFSSYYSILLPLCSEKRVYNKQADPLFESSN